MDARILVVEDDLTVAEVVVDYLRHAGLEPRHAMDGQAALEIAAAWRPDLVVLDLMLPGVSGLEVCRRLRQERDAQVPLPVIMLTALGEESDRVLGLENGADDYVTKPFSPRELSLRVQAVLRRARAAGTAVVTPRPVRSGRLEVDVAARRALNAGRELDLTVREFDLLAFFVSHPGRAFTRAELLADGCGGIPEADLPHVFDLAWRGTDARSPAPDSGAGLGLAIVRGVVEAHGGSVRVMNTGDGCCFEMRLPACS